MFLYDVFRVVESSAPINSGPSKIVKIAVDIPADNSLKACQKAKSFAKARYNGELPLVELVALQGDKVEDKQFK